MTIICVRDGVLACDSLCADEMLVAGEAIKYRSVPEKFGGGYIAGAGSAALFEKISSDFLAGNDINGSNELSMIHLMKNGVISEFGEHGWWSCKAPFYAHGCGRFFAMGAMAQGATAEEAVKLTCEWVHECGGEIHVMGVNNE